MLKADKDRLVLEKESIKKEKDIIEIKIRTLWEQENKQRAEQKEKIIDREVKKSQKWSTILFVVGLLVMLLVLGIVSCYFFVAEKDTIQTINDFCNFKPVSIVIGIIVLIFNSFTVSNFYN